ncbi:unnamed protein product [Sphenostylis stenocarpa]|uniref:HTH OST-type domain-containing protein n=1 Tax=Sphenostylis stenocarpa TaxID=92480 RepID=A0AA86T619_9FABA|nr:unnamed protein product [Sphenostylis stenocarpa]
MTGLNLIGTEGSSTSALQAPTLLLQLQACAFSSSSTPHHSRDVRVSVWWDFKSCTVPDDVDASKVGPAIVKAVRANGVKGPLHIAAFGNVNVLPKPDKDALASTGIQFIHIFNDLSVPLENPFLAAEQPTSLQNVEISEPSLDLKLGAVPMSVVRQIKHILNLHPKGISITDLCGELVKCDVPLDTSFYGFRSFSCFLLAMPHIQLQPVGNDNFCVCLPPSESPDPFDSSVVPSTSSVVKNNERVDADETPSPANIHARSMNDDSKSFQHVPFQTNIVGECVYGKLVFPSLVEGHEFQTQNDLEKSLLSSEKVADLANAQQLETQQSSKENKFSKTKTSSLKAKSKRSSDIGNVKSEDASHKTIEKHTTSGNRYAGNDNTTIEDNVDDSLIDRTHSGIADTYNRRPTFFSWIRSWWPFWKSNAKSDDLAAHQNKVESHLEDSKAEPELFSSAEKKWLVEIPSHGVNGFRSVFMIRESQFKLPNSFEHDVKKQNQPHTRVSAAATKLKYIERSRNDILEDLHTLVNEILRDHSKGYNIILSSDSELYLSLPKDNNKESTLEELGSSQTFGSVVDRVNDEPNPTQGSVIWKMQGFRVLNPSLLQMVSRHQDFGVVGFRELPDVWDVAPAIMKAVRASGIKGPLQINAFGDVMQLSKSNREALSHTGIYFTHNPGFSSFIFFNSSPHLTLFTSEIISRSSLIGSFIFFNSSPHLTLFASEIISRSSLIGSQLNF